MMKMILKIIFWIVIIINLLFYIGLPSLFLFTPFPKWASSSFWPNITDIYIAWGIGFFTFFAMPFLLLFGIALLFTKPPRAYLLWIFIILNAITIFIFHTFLINQPFDKLLGTFNVAIAALKPNDSQWTSPDTSLRWGQDLIKLPDAWEITTGISSVKIGVIDAGIDIIHDDLRNNININSRVFLLDPHGTFVAGIIGAKGNNTTATAGKIRDTSLKV